MTNAARHIERRSIDWIPHGERHGSVTDLGTLWFVGNINLTGLATGVAVLSSGADLGWTIIAGVIGSLLGTLFMALHSSQGPHLGLPQLVQSRAQFGHLGAALTVWIFAFINYVAYNTSDALLAGDAARVLWGLDPQVGYLLSTLLASALALFGYRWIHHISRWLALPLLVVMAGITVAALANPMLATAWMPGAFEAGPFATALVISFGFQLGWAPYVSDYSRYLPTSVAMRATFWWTYLPSAVSAIWVLVLGAAAMAAAPVGSTPVAALSGLCDRLVPGFGAFAVAALLAGLLSVMAINQYGGMMSLISILDSFRPVRPSRRVRAIAIGIVFIVVWLIAHQVGIERFTAFYGTVLVFLAYLFTPWTAVNLVDYFWVRKGRYAVSELFRPDGVYGRWGWRGNLAYALGFACMVPFMVSDPYTGPLARALGGIDLSPLVGLAVAALAYLGFCRTLDLGGEYRSILIEFNARRHPPAG